MFSFLIYRKGFEWCSHSSQEKYEPVHGMVLWIQTQRSPPSFISLVAFSTAVRTAFHGIMVTILSTQRLDCTKQKPMSPCLHKAMSSWHVRVTNGPH